MRICSCIVVAESGDQPFTFCCLAIDGEIRYVIRLANFFTNSIRTTGNSFWLISVATVKRSIGPDREECPSQDVVDRAA
jgi:hypothetical protein